MTIAHVIIGILLAYHVNSIVDLFQMMINCLPYIFADWRNAQHTRAGGRHSQFGFFEPETLPDRVYSPHGRTYPTSVFTELAPQRDGEGSAGARRPRLRRRAGHRNLNGRVEEDDFFGEALSDFQLHAAGRLPVGGERAVESQDNEGEEARVRRSSEERVGSDEVRCCYTGGCGHDDAGRCRTRWETGCESEEATQASNQSQGSRQACVDSGLQRGDV